jgi:hypothetical protein
MAEIVSGKVIRVIVVKDASWAAINLGGTWIETKPDGSIRGKFAAVGDNYDAVNDVFSSPEEDLEPA